MFNTIDYIRGIIESMTFTQSISNINLGTPGQTTFDTCKTYWVFKDYNIVVDGNTYKVLDFEINKSITIKGTLIGTEPNYIVAAPHFFHGTPMQATVSLGSEKNWRDKLPFVYVIEPMREVRDLSPGRVLDRTSDLQMLFMLPGKLSESVEDQYESAVKPTDNMVFEWEKKIMIDPNIEELSLAHSKNRVNYGVWLRKLDRPKKEKQDNQMRLINEAISGIEYSISIPFKRIVCDLNAKCK